MIISTGTIAAQHENLVIIRPDVVLSKPRAFPKQKYTSCTLTAVFPDGIISVLWEREAYASVSFHRRLSG
jgi:hypothetical protein